MEKVIKKTEVYKLLENELKARLNQENLVITSNNMGISIVSDDIINCIEDIILFGTYHKLLCYVESDEGKPKVNLFK